MNDESGPRGAAPPRIEKVRRLLEADPADPELRYLLGVELLRAERAAEAAAEFRRALDARDDYSAAWRDLGRALLRDDRPGEAVPVLERGISVARERGDLQAAREMEVWLRRARAART